MILEAAMYEIYAFEYAKYLHRRASENFIGGDLHDGPMPLAGPAKTS